MESPKKWSRLAIVPVALTLAAAALAGCGSSSNTDSGVEQDSKATIVAWGDAARKPAFDAYQKEHPDAKVKFEVVDSTTYLSKIQLANKVGSGWPDVIFDSIPNDVASLQSPLFNYAQKLDDLVPKDVQKNFATQNSICTIDGHLWCLQNDLAQDVMWYNKPLLEEFGYALPKTWEEYAELGKKVAKEHPGYVIGSAGGPTLFYDYLWASGCPLQDVKSSTEVAVNTKDVKCTRVSDALDPLLTNGSVSRLSVFAKEFADIAKAGKLLMLPAASWFGDFVFKPATGFAFPNGTLAAGAMPTWSGETTNYSGAEGGGIYVVSSHSANIKGAAALAQWITTDTTFQASSATYPAYIPAAKAWLEKAAKDPFYAQDPSAVLTDQASKINPAVGAARYDASAPVNSTLVAAVTSGQTIASAWEALQLQVAGLAGTAGYAVSSK